MKLRLKKNAISEIVVQLGKIVVQLGKIVVELGKFSLLYLAKTDKSYSQSGSPQW